MHPCDRVVTVTTPAGTSASASTPANTLHIVSQLGARLTPITGRDVRVLKTLPTPPPRTQEALLLGHQVTISKGAVASSVSPSAASIGTSIMAIINGIGIGAVTAVEFAPADGLTVGAPVAAADGKSVSVSLSISGDAPQTLRTVRVLAGTTLVQFGDPSKALFRITTPQPQIDGISPLFVQVGAAPAALTVYGKNFQNAQPHYYDPNKAQIQDFDAFWEFVSGPLNAGSFGPNLLDNTFGPQVVFPKAPPAGQVNLPPSAGLQFFGQVDIDARSKDMVVALKDIDGSEVFSRRLHAKPGKGWGRDD